MFYIATNYNPWIAPLTPMAGKATKLYQVDTPEHQIFKLASRPVSVPAVGNPESVTAHSFIICKLIVSIVQIVK